VPERWLLRQARSGSKHEGVPGLGGARHLHGRRWAAIVSAAIAGARVGDYVTFAGRDNFTLVLANSSRCLIEV
jgi:hypothetical protein